MTALKSEVSSIATPENNFHLPTSRSQPYPSKTQRSGSNRFIFKGAKRATKSQMKPYGYAFASKNQ